jgi:hypothetical protein
MSSEPVLTPRDLLARLNEGLFVEWHPLYERELWRDKDGPLELRDVWRMTGEREETWMVMYRCSDTGCLWCRHPESPAGRFHHKLIRPDGMDSVGRCEEISVGRRRSKMVLVDQPVFRDRAR